MNLPRSANSVSVLSLTITPLSILAIGKNVSVFAVIDTREVSTGNSFNRSAPGAAKFVAPVALSNRLASSLELTVDSAVSNPKILVGVVLYF